MSVLHKQPATDRLTDGSAVLPGFAASITLIGAVWTAVSLQDLWGAAQNPVMPSDLHNNGDLLLVVGLLITTVGVVTTSATTTRTFRNAGLSAGALLGLVLIGLSTLHATSMLWANLTNAQAAMTSTVWAWLLRYDGLLAVAGLVLLVVSHVFVRAGRAGPSASP